MVVENENCVAKPYIINIKMVGAVLEYIPYLYN